MVKNVFFINILPRVDTRVDISTVNKIKRCPCRTTYDIVQLFSQLSRGYVRFYNLCLSPLFYDFLKPIQRIFNVSLAWLGSNWAYLGWKWSRHNLVMWVLIGKLWLSRRTWNHSSTKSHPRVWLSHPFWKTSHLGEAKVGRTSQVNLFMVGHWIYDKVIIFDNKLK